MSILKAVIYLRVSTDEQAEKGTSLETQELACRQRADTLQAIVAKVVRDEGVSGAFYASRPGIQEALALIEAGQAEVLIVYSISRMSREVEHQQTIKKRVEQAGGRLIVCDMPMEDTAEGNLMFVISGGFAQYERQVIRKRTMTGRRRRAEEGQQPSRSRCPYGYHIYTKADILQGVPVAMLGQYEIIEEQAVIVRRVFSEYAGGSSLNQVARRLNDAAVPTSREGGHWRRCTIQRMLLNPVYKGAPAFGRFEARTDERRALDGRNTTYIVRANPAQWVTLSAPALVDEQTFALCQQRLIEGRNTTSGNPDRVFLLSSMLRCPHCGKAMRGKSIRRQRNKQKIGYSHYYMCQNAETNEVSPEKRCSKQCYVIDEMETLTCKAIEEVAAQPRLLQNALRLMVQRMTERTEPSEDLAAKLHELEKRERATIEAQIAGTMAGANPQFYAAALQEVARKREEIQARLDHQPSLALDMRQVAEHLHTLLADVQETLRSETLTVAERRQLLRSVVKKAVPKQDENGAWGVNVTLISPFATKSQPIIAQTVSMISTLARGTMTVRPSASCASSTRTHVSDST